MKILYVTTISITMRFFSSFIENLRSQGHRVELACNTDDAAQRKDYIHIPFSRNPFAASNICAYRKLKNLVERGGYDIVHCHTPVAAFITRLACRKARKTGTKVFYTAHGFHFYKGAPLLNWLVYYTAEKLCARFTDLLMTINKEDYALAQNKLKKAGRIGYVQGVGIDVNKFAKSEDSLEKAKAFRRRLNLTDEDFLIISVGELNANKNHQVVLKALSLLNNEHIHYAIAGVGDKHDYLLELAESLNLKDRFHLLGYVDDIPTLYHCADLFCFPSIREGLPVSVIEAMSSGLPLIVADNRGTRDCCKDGVNGIVCSAVSKEDFAKAIDLLMNSPDLSNSISHQNIIDAKKYDIKIVNDVMDQIYFGQ